MLSFSSFVPASDEELRRQAAAFGKQAGIEVRVDTISSLQLPVKLAAEAQSQSGHDIVRTSSADPFLYESQLVDVGRCRRQARQAARRLVRLRRGIAPDQLGLAFRSVALELLPGQLQHGSVPEGRARAPEDLGGAPQAREDPQGSGPPRRHCHQPRQRRQHHIHVGALVLRRQGVRGRRQDPGHQLREDRAGDRVVQGALPGCHGARGPSPGTTPPTTVAHLRQLSDARVGDLAVLGFCMGGRITYLLAGARPASWRAAGVFGSTPS
jgi:Dienelactone hydrolase family